MTIRNLRRTLRLQVLLLLIFAILSTGSTCVVVEEGQGEEAYRDESAEGQMQEEEVDELDRETGY
jgi:hypothetical protein